MKSYLFLLLGLIIGFLGALFMVLNLSQQFYLVVIPSVVTFIGAFLVVLQVNEAEKAVRLTAMPSLNFDIKSGKTFLNKNIDQLSLADRLFTKVFVKNDSRFIISCLIEIILRIEYKDGKVSVLFRKLRDKKNPFVIFVGRVLAFPQSDLLSGALLQKSHNKLNEEDAKRFESERDKIKEVSAEFIITSGPFIQDSFKFRFKPLRWRFDLDEEVWLDPQTTKDYNIEPLH